MRCTKFLVLALIVPALALALLLIGACSGSNDLASPDPTLMQAIFEQQLGIPTAGRTRFQRLLADQWRIPATEYVLLQRGLLGGLGDGNEDQSFQEYLTGRTGPVSSMQGDFLCALTSMNSNEQLDLLEGLGAFREQAMQQVLAGALRHIYPVFIADNQAAQVFSGPVRREFEISPEKAGGTPFLNYLQARYLPDTLTNLMCK